MKIIDKHTDFYDYYQNIYKDDTFTFDRRDSFLLTKDFICKELSLLHDNSWNKFHFLLLQVCNNFWLFLVENISVDSFGNTEDFDIELLSTWKSYLKPRKLCSLNIIDFYFYDRKSKDKIRLNVGYFIQDINTNNYKFRRSLNKCIIYNGNKKLEKHIPILRTSGLSAYINPQDIYLAFEEYFSLEKSSSERREPIGTTDIDKIESHGFDKKVSFRGV